MFRQMPTSGLYKYTISKYVQVLLTNNIADEFL